MKSFILAAITAINLGMGIANAATPQAQSQAQQTEIHRPNYYNWLEGGGG